MQVSISGVIITYNEEKRIEKCIRSLQKVADEILVVDSYSTDRTKEICKNLKVRFVNNKFQGHIEQKNFAKSIASNNYIISLDADEELDNTAIESILKIKKNWTHEGFYINRLNNYCGKWVRYGSWYPDRKLRLWDRRKGEWSGINPHDQFKLTNQDPKICIPGHILHYTVDNPKQYQKQVAYFSDISAKAYYKNNKTSSFFKIYFNPAFRFFRDYILKLGVLDGKAGFEICKETSYGTYLKYLKLKALHSKK